MNTHLRRIVISTMIAIAAVASSATTSHSGMQYFRRIFPSMADCEKTMEALLRAGKISQYTCVPLPSNTIPTRVAPPERVVNALKNYRTLKVQVGSNIYMVDKADMSHILKRHHPNYWNGKIAEDAQTFFNERMTISDIQQAIKLVMLRRQNEVMKIGFNGIGQLPPTQVGGVTYVLGLNKGHIGQFYPIVP